MSEVTLKEHAERISNIEGKLDILIAFNVIAIILTTVFG